MIPDTRESGQQHSTYSGYETRNKSPSVKTDVNPSDIRTQALGRERFHRLTSMLGMGTELSETSSPGNWYNGDE